MNVEVRAPLRAQKSRVGLVDVDIHPKSSLEDLRPFLSNHWWHYLQTYGTRQRHGYVRGYPVSRRRSRRRARRDAWPPDGGLPASNLDFMRQQHLDHYGID